MLRSRRPFALGRRWLSAATRITPDVEAAKQDAAFLAWCMSHSILMPAVELGHCVFPGHDAPQRGLFATTSIKAGEPIAAVPLHLCLGRAHHPNARLVALTDQFFPRGSPPLRPLTPEEIMKEPQATQTHFAPALQLAVLLVLEYANPKSTWRPWLDIMPSPDKPLPNAPFLDAGRARKLLAEASHAGTTVLRGAELKAVIHDVTERVGAYQEWMTVFMMRNHVLKTMLERVGKARFDGDAGPAARWFRWALSMVDSRANEGINNIEPNSPVMQLDPWMHLTPEGKEQLTQTARAQQHRRDQRNASGSAGATGPDGGGLGSPVPRKLREVLNETVPAPDAKPLLPDLTDLPVSITPSIVPLFDFINHADGDQFANVEIQAAGFPPYSPLEKRMHCRTLRRLGLPEAQMTELEQNDSALSKWIYLKACRPIEAGQQLLLWYAPQVDAADTTFLLTYGFVPRTLSDDVRLAQLQTITEVNEERADAESFYARLSGSRGQQAVERQEKAIPKGIFSDPANVRGIPTVQAVVDSDAPTADDLRMATPTLPAAAAAGTATSSVRAGHRGSTDASRKPKSGDVDGLDAALLSELGLSDLLQPDPTPAAAAITTTAAPRSTRAKPVAGDRRAEEAEELAEMQRGMETAKIQLGMFGVCACVVTTVSAWQLLLVGRVW